MSSVPRRAPTHRNEDPAHKGTVLAPPDMADSPALTLTARASARWVEGSLCLHIEDKDDLLTGIVEARALPRSILAPTADDWRSDMRATAVSAHDALLRHAWACQLVPPDFGTHDLRRAWATSSRSSRDSGTPGSTPDAASRGYHALDSHHPGFTIWHSATPSLRHPPRSSIDTLNAPTDPDTFPYRRARRGAHEAAEHLRGRVSSSLGLNSSSTGLERYVHPT